MDDWLRPPGARTRHALAALVVVVAALVTTHGAARAETPGAMARIDAILGSAEIARRIEAWGLTVADVRHDVQSMTPAERIRLARVLTRRWLENETHDTADLQARFLVTMSLMRQSRLFASIVSNGPARLLR